MAEPKKIAEIWAWICTEPDGGEGVPASSRVIPGHIVPLLGADETRVRGLEAEARYVAGLHGAPLKLVRFTDAVVVEVVTPEWDAFREAKQNG